MVSRPTVREVGMDVANILKMSEVVDVDVFVRFKRLVKLKWGITVAQKFVESLEDGRFGATRDEEVKGEVKEGVDIGNNPDNCLLCYNAIDLVQAIEEDNIRPLGTFDRINRVEGFDYELQRLGVHCLGEQSFIFIKCLVHEGPKERNSFDHLGNKRGNHQ